MVARAYRFQIIDVLRMLRSETHNETYKHIVMQCMNLQKTTSVALLV